MRNQADASELHEHAVGVQLLGPDGPSIGALALEQTDEAEIRTLCDMLISASDHVLERYDSERDRFISRAKQLAVAVQEMLEDLEAERAANKKQQLA